MSTLKNLGKPKPSSSEVSQMADGELPIDQYLTILLIAALAVGRYWAFKQIRPQRSRD